jgi:hypothetical protein
LRGSTDNPILGIFLCIVDCLIGCFQGFFVSRPTCPCAGINTHFFPWLHRNGLTTMHSAGWRSTGKATSNLLNELGRSSRTEAWKLLSTTT